MATKQEQMFSLIEKSFSRKVGMREFCRLHSISTGSFYKWKDKYDIVHGQRTQQDDVSMPDTGTFIPLSISDASPGQTMNAIKVRYPNGVEVELSNPDITMLRNLIKIF